MWGKELKCAKYMTYEHNKGEFKTNVTAQTPMDSVVKSIPESFINLNRNHTADRSTLKASYTDIKHTFWEQNSYLRLKIDMPYAYILFALLKIVTAYNIQSNEKLVWKNGPKIKRLRDTKRRLHILFYRHSM